MARVTLITDLAIFPANAGNKARIASLMGNIVSLGHELVVYGLGLTPEEVDRIAPHCHSIYYSQSRRLRSIRPIYVVLRRQILGRLVVRDLCKPNVDFWYWPHWQPELREFARLVQTDIAMVEYVFFSKALLAFPSTTRTIIDTHDVFTNRQKKIRSHRWEKCYKYLSGNEERKGLLRAERLIAIQHHEQQYLSELVERPVFCVGHTVNICPCEGINAPNIAFIATDYSPNNEGLRRFMEECMPGIQQRVPGVKLIVAGTVCRSISNNYAWLIKRGVIEEVTATYNECRIAINPVVVGTGLKTKTIEALGHGLPVITYPCGAEGLEDVECEGLVVCRDSSAMVNAIAELLTVQSKWQLAREAAISFVRNWNRRQKQNLAQALAFS